MGTKLKAKDKDVTRGRSALRFSIPGAFVDEGGLIVECRAYEMGPRGGRGQEVVLTPAYWNGLLPKLAERVNV